jgi:hypothetical protein
MRLIPGKEPGGTEASVTIQSMPQSHPRLSTGDKIAIAVAILAAAIAIGVVAFEHAYPDASTATWRIIFYASVVIAIGALAYLIFDLVIKPRLPIRITLSRRSWAIAIIGIVALCTLGGASYVASNWPVGFLQSQSPTATASEREGPIMSRLDHFIMRCDVPPPPPSKTVNQTLADLSDYKQKLDILGDAYASGEDRLAEVSYRVKL